MTEHKKKYRQSTPIWLTIVGLFVLGFLLAYMLRDADIAVMNPKGTIAGEQMRLIIVVVVLMLEIGIPTLLALYFVAWKYRESNEKATYDPASKHGKLFVFSLWAIPSIIVLMIGYIMWPATHRLEPKKTIISDNKPITIKVVAMRWKWLFIYPDQNIATVNYVQIPVNTPVQFDISADEAPMSSFWIPHLGGQIYAMTGHVNRLNLLADTTGDFPGSSIEINGRGFAGMRFTTRSSSQSDFDSWVKSVRQSTDVLNESEYKELLEPSENNQVVLYSTAEPDLYDNMLMKYSGTHGHPAENE